MPSPEGFGRDTMETGLNKKLAVPAKLAAADKVDNDLMADVAKQVEGLDIE